MSYRVRITDACITARNFGKTNMKLLPGGVNIILEGFKMSKALIVKKSRLTLHGLICFVDDQNRLIQSIHHANGFYNNPLKKDLSILQKKALFYLYETLSDNLDLFMEDKKCQK
jgi:hypothetical protein